MNNQIPIEIIHTAELAERMETADVRQGFTAACRIHWAIQRMLTREAPSTLLDTRAAVFFDEHSKSWEVMHHIVSHTNHVFVTYRYAEDNEGAIVCVDLRFETRELGIRDDPWLSFRFRGRTGNLLDIEPSANFCRA